MKLKPKKTFTKAVKFLQLVVTPSAIESALSNSQFNKLQELEAEMGFREKPPGVKHFFRKGMVGDWQTTLTELQIQRIIDEHGDVMQIFGYVDKNKNPILEYG